MAGDDGVFVMVMMGVHMGLPPIRCDRNMSVMCIGVCGMSIVYVCVLGVSVLVVWCLR